MDPSILPQFQITATDAKFTRVSHKFLHLPKNDENQGKILLGIKLWIRFDLDRWLKFNGSKVGGDGRGFISKEGSWSMMVMSKERRWFRELRVFRRRAQVWIGE